MARPRVIIADEDESYIVPLQFKFVTDFFNKIDLEVITDRAYFDDYFSKPQNAEILIVSDELYDSSLQRHNIQNIFVMMEQYDEGGTGDLNVTQLFKYTSIKEIFNEITGKSAGALNIAAVEKKDTQIIVFTSGYGGAGKTTISRNVALCLANNYKKVLYVNNGSLQSFQYEFNNSTKLVINDVRNKLYDSQNDLYIELKHLLRTEGFTYLPAFKTSLMSIGLSKDFFNHFVDAAKKSNEFDYIIVDLESVYDESMIRFFDSSEKVVIITEQKRSSIEATNELVTNISMNGNDKYVFVCNKFNKEKNNALIDSTQKMLFSISEYVDYIDDDLLKDIENSSKNMGMKKISFLLM